MRTILFLALLLMCTACRKAHEGQRCAPGDCERHLSCEDGTCRVCRETRECSEKGWCEYDDDEGRCAPASVQDCRQAEVCRLRHQCELVDAVCTDARDPNVKEGGCPCGCDHSEELVSELRTRDRDSALEEARRSLATIGEREQLGYVTEAMVSHRLRLRGLEGALLGPGEPRFEMPLSPRAAALRAAREEQTPRIADGLSVRSELLLFGATTEVVRGKPKQLEACFRLWLELENSGASGRTIARPVLRADRGVELDVRRWYVEDGDGTAWDGELGAGEKRSVLLVGYLRERLPPGVPVTVRYAVGGVELAESSATLDSWSAHADAAF